MSKRKNRQISRSWESPSVPITSQSIAALLGALPSSSGVVVNKDTVFALPAFMRGVDLIASTMGRVDCKVFKSAKGGGRVEDENHAAHYLLSRRPNQWQTPFEFKRALASQAIYSGNSYAFVARDEITAEPTALVLLDPESTYPCIVRNTKDAGDVKVYYVTEINGQSLTLQFDEVVHIKGLSSDGFMGIRLIDMCKEILGLGIAVIKYGSMYFTNSGSPSTVIEFPEYFKNAEQIELFRKTFENVHSGLSNAHKLCILQNGAKLAKTVINNNEAQWLESRQMSQTDIANLLGLPPHKLGSNIATSYGSLEQENLSLLNDCFDKWFTNIEQQLEMKLLTEVEQIRNSRWIEFDRSKLLQADHATKVKNVIDLVNNGLMYPNHACQELNLPAVDDDGEEKLRLPTNIGIQGEEPVPVAPQIAPAAPPATEDKKPDTRLERMTRGLVERFLVRLKKASEQAEKKDERLDLASHQEVFMGQVDGLVERSTVDGLFAPLVEELTATTRDQQARVIERIDAEVWTRRLVNE